MKKIATETIWRTLHGVEDNYQLMRNQNNNFKLLKFYSIIVDKPIQLKL